METENVNLQSLQDEDEDTFYVNEVAIFDTLYKLKNAIAFEKSNQDGAIFLENKDLGIIAAGENLEAAILDLSYDFDYSYTRYNELADVELHERAIKIKYYIKSIVEQVITK